MTFLVFFGAVLGAAPQVQQIVTATNIEQTFEEIVKRHEVGEAGEKSYELDEKGVNVYLREQRAAELPKAVKSPWVRFEDKIAVVGATVNLDEFKSQMPQSAILQFLSGFVPLELSARLQSGAGIGEVIFERISLAGIELPPGFITELMTRTDGTTVLPDSFRLGEPFPLPYRLESIRSIPGAMLIKQVIDE